MLSFLGIGLLLLLLDEAKNQQGGAGRSVVLVVARVDWLGLVCPVWYWCVCAVRQWLSHTSPIPRAEGVAAAPPQ